jgi:hypothetical protein
MAVNLAYPQDMRDALDVFSQGAENLVAGWVKTLGAPAPVIYHYTNDVGLHGILESSQLWLTDIFRLNDPSEVDHGFSRAIDVLKRKVASGPQDRGKFAEGLAGFAKRYGIEKLGKFFICSFSCEPTILGSGALMRITDVAMRSVSMRRLWKTLTREERRPRTRRRS